MVFQIVKEVRDIKRFREILTVLFEEGFDFLIEKMNLGHKVPLTKRVRSRVEAKKDHPLEKRLRLTLERLGPTFIKFGQVLSVRPDLVPMSYIKELEKLQDDVPAFPYEEVRKQVKSELGREIKDIFASFDEKPIASASISQVHRATLRDGSKVAVKVQRPDVRKIMETDVEIMMYAAKMLEKHMPNIRRFRPAEIVGEFWSWTEKELDFRKEAMNAKRFARNFAGSKKIKIPRVYEVLTTEKILVMEFIDGVEIHHLKNAKKEVIRQIIRDGFESILTQVFVHGFFHGDPHPGNILVMKDKRIAFVDFGIVGHFDEKLKTKCTDMFYAMIKNDSEGVVDALIELSETDAENTDELKNDVSDILESLQDADISRVKVSRALEEIMDLALRYGMRMPRPFVLFGKTIITLEGIALEYDPNFRIMDNSKPFMEKLLVEKYSPATQFRNLAKSIMKLRKFSEEFPGQASRTLKRLEKGSIKVDIEDTDISKLSLEIDRSGNRVAYSMLIAALLIVGALTINYGSPAIGEIPLISGLSFVLALLLSMVLVYSILREKNIIK